MSGLANFPGARSGIVGGAGGGIGYEVGTWTPAITRTTSNPSQTGTVHKAGHYVKTGKLVYVEGYYQLNGFSSGVGQWQCSLPFTAASNIHNQSIERNRIYMDADSTDWYLEVQGGANVVQLWTLNNYTAYTTNITYLIWYFSGHYLIA